MSYRTTVEKHSDHICVEVAGTRQAEAEHADAIATWAPVVAECRASGLNRLLIRYRLHGRFSLMHAFDLTDNPEQIGWMRSLRIAVVRLEGTPLDELRAVETVAVNRGFPLQVFVDERAARRWLLADR